MKTSHYSKLLSCVLCIILIISSLPVTAERNVSADRSINDDFCVTVNDTEEKTAFYEVDPGTMLDLKVTVTAEDMTGITYVWYKGVRAGRSFEYSVIDDVDGDLLTISSVEKTSVYECLVNDNYGHSDSVRFEIKVNNGFCLYPSGTDSSFKNIYVNPNDNAQLNVNVSGIDLSSVELWWEESFGSDYVRRNDFTGYTVEISNINEYREYRCAAIDRYDNLAETYFYVFVENNLSAVDSESEGEAVWHTVDWGESLYLSVIATADNTDGLTYKWYKNDPDGNYIGEEDHIIIPAVTENVSYHCLVQDRYMNTTTVDYFISVELVNNLTAVDSETQSDSVSLYITPGDSINLSVSASAVDTSMISYRWYETDFYDNVNELTETSNSIILSNVSQVRNYCCEIQDGHDNYAYVYYYLAYNNNLTAVVDGTESDCATFYVDPGDSIELSVSVSAADSSMISYEWYETDLNGVANALYETGSRIMLSNLSGGKNYYCSVQDGYDNNAFVYFYLVFDNGFSAFDSGSLSNDVIIGVNPGDNVYLSVSATAKDMSMISYQWYQDDASGNYAAIQETNSSLTLSNVTTKSELFCQVQDGYGNYAYVYYHLTVDNNLTAVDSETLSENSFISVNVGDTVQLSVTADANDPSGITYKWYKNNEYELSDTGSSITLSNISEAGQYRCTVKDRYGNEKSVWYQIAIDNGFHAEDSDTGNNYVEKSVWYGESFALSVTASARDDSGITYQWNKDYNPIPGETANCITVLNITEPALYSCNVYDRFGNVVTVEFRLVFDNCLVAFDKETQNSTVSKPVAPGGNLQLEIDVTAHDTSKVTYHWYYFDSNETSHYLPDTGSSISLSNITESVRYVCAVEDGYGGSTSVTYMITVVNNLTAVDVGELTTSVTKYVMPGGSVQLSVNVEATDLSNISYEWSGLKTLTQENIDMSNETGSSITVTGITEPRRYCFTARDIYGNTASVWYEIIIDNALLATDSETGGRWVTRDVDPTTGTTLTVSVSAYDKSHISYRWYMYDSSWNYNDLPNTGNSVSVSGLRGHEQYYCEVNDGYGNKATVSFELYVDNRLVVTANNSISEHYYGSIEYSDPVTLRTKVSAHDLSGITYVWYEEVKSAQGTNYEVMAGQSGDSISVASITESCMYECMVTDAYGNTGWAYFHLSIDNAFRAYANENDYGYDEISVEAGSDIVLNVRVEGKDLTGLSVVWERTEGDEWNFEPVPNAQGMTVEVKNIRNKYNYRCIVTDRFNNREEVNFSIIVDNKLRVTDSKTGYKTVQLSLTPGDNTALTLAISAEDLTGMDIRWTKTTTSTEGWDQTTEMTQYKGKRNVDLVSVMKNASYTCTVFDRYKNCETVYYNINVNNLSAVSAGNRKEKEELSLNVGDIALLKVDVTAEDQNGIVYSWTKGKYDKWGQYLVTDEYPNNVTDELEISNIRESCVYRCNVKDLYGSSKTVLFNIVIDNNFTVSANDVEVMGNVEIPILIKKGETKDLIIIPSGDDLTGVQYGWEADGLATVNWSGNTATVSNVNAWTEVRCTVTDRFNNQIRVTYAVRPTDLGEWYIGTSGNTEITSLKEDFYVVDCGINGVCVVPLISKEDASRKCGMDLYSNELYVWLKFTSRADEVDQKTLRSSIENSEGLRLKGFTPVGSDELEFEIGIRLWQDLCEYGPFGDLEGFVGYDTVFSFEDGPIDGKTITASVGVQEGVQHSETDFSYYYQGDTYEDYFIVNMYVDDDEKALVYEITPLYTFDELKYKGVLQDNTFVACKLGLGMNQHIFDAFFRGRNQFEQYFSYLDENPNICPTGMGGDTFEFGYGLTIRAWTENDETISARSVAPDGKVFFKSVRIITHADPNYQIKNITTAPTVNTDVVDTANQNFDQSLLEIVAANISSSESLGIKDDIQAAAWENVDARELVSDLLEDGQDDLNDVKVQTHLQVSVLEANTSSDGKDSTLVLDITPKYEVIASDANGVATTLADGDIEVKDKEVEIALYVGDTLGESVRVTIKHMKDDEYGTEFTYTGTVDSDGYLRFKNPHGFSTFEISATPAPTFTLHSLVLSGNIGVNLFMNLPEIDGVDYSTSYMEFKLSGKNGNTTIDYYDPQDMNVTKKYYGFTVYVNSIQMADTIYATFHYFKDGEELTVEDTYSVVEYLNTIKYGDFSDKMKALAVAIGDYGYYAQPYLSDKHGWDLGPDHEEMPASPYLNYTMYDETDYQEALGYVAENELSITRDTLDSGIEKVTYALGLDTATGIYVYLKPKAEYEGDITAVIGEGTENVAVKQSDGRYLVYIEGISAHNLGRVYTIQVTAGSSFEVNVCALSYVETMLASETSSDLLKTLVVSLYRYYDKTMQYRAN